MAELRTLLEDAGYGNVRTYIASGNVLLDGPAARNKLGSELERLVADAFDVTTAVILRKPRELAATVEAHPFAATPRTRTSRSSPGGPPSAAAVRRARGLRPTAVLAGAELYLQLPARRARIPTLERADRVAARRPRHAPQLAHGRRAGRAGRRGVGSRRHRAKGELRWHWHGSLRSRSRRSDRIAALKSEIEGGERPEGLPATEMMILHDPEAESATCDRLLRQRGRLPDGRRVPQCDAHIGHAGQADLGHEARRRVRDERVGRASLRPRGRRGGRSAGRRRGRSPARTARCRPRGRAGAGSRRCGLRRALRARSGSSARAGSPRGPSPPARRRAPRRCDRSSRRRRARARRGRLRRAPQRPPRSRAPLPQPRRR